MIPTHLLELACQEFPTYEDCIKANPYHSHDRIYWREHPSHELYTAISDFPPKLEAVDERVMEVKLLPSGLWGWVPTHPEDQAFLAEFKIDKFANAQLIIVDGSFRESPYINDHQNKENRERFHKHLKSAIAHKFLAQMEPDKIYQTCLRVIELPCNQYLAVKITYILLVSEKVN